MRKSNCLGIVLLVIMVLGVVGCGGTEVFRETSGDVLAETTPVEGDRKSWDQPPPTATPYADSSTDSAAAAGEVVNVTNRENPYVFDPSNFNFKVGTTYILTFAPVTEFHTFTVDELGLNINVMPGEKTEVPFTPTAAQVGTFVLFCVPHQANGMVGEVAVQ